jgi:methylenetetrahydrofolate reductase (NADPH)
VFPNREILQPTIFDHDSFVVWSEEVFQLWTKSWAALYDDETESAALLYEVRPSIYLPACLDLSDCMFVWLVGCSVRLL